MPAKNVTGRRIGAAFSDLALYTALCFGIFFLMAESTDGSVLLERTNINLQVGDRTWYVEGGEAGLVYLLDVIAGLMLFGLLPGLTGWTPGKLITGLRVVRADRRRAGIGRSLARPFLWIADGFPYFLPGLVGFILILSTKEHRRVADYVAGTYVVDRAEAGVAPAPVAPAAPTAVAADWYPDPSGAPVMRWWDGQHWTAHTR
jgi:uncharacterized RDD family membrane protein YckC